MSSVSYCAGLTIATRYDLAGLPPTQMDRLQSVLNAAVRMFFLASVVGITAAPTSSLVTNELPYQLQVVLTRLPVLARTVSARTMSPPRCKVWRMSYTGGGRLRSSSTANLISSSKHRTPVDRVFPVVAARAWNALPHNVTSPFRRRLKTHLFEGHMVTSNSNRDSLSKTFFRVCVLFFYI